MPTVQYEAYAKVGVGREEQFNVDVKISEQGEQ
jgi:hypothetical protein